LPELDQSRLYRNRNGEHQMAEVVPDPTQPGVCYVAVHQDLDTDNACVDYTARGLYLTRELLAMCLNGFRFQSSNPWYSEPALPQRPWY
jgi:hypothetical protein